MSRALTVCIGDGCGELVVRGRCSACEAKARKARAQRNGPKQRNPMPEHWRQIRASYLRRHTDPVRGVPLCECEECAPLPASMREVATDVHHKVDRAEGGTSADSNLEQLAHGHHSRITATRMPRVVRRGPL